MLLQAVNVTAYCLRRRTLLISVLHNMHVISIFMVLLCFMQCVREGWKDKLNEQKNEGCLVTGHLEVNKVAGNFHFAPGKSFQQHHVHGELHTCTILL